MRRRVRLGAQGAPTNLGEVSREVKPESKEVLAARRVKEGSLAGGESVKQKFAEHITRSYFCDAVGIHRNTLKKWEKLGIFTPGFTKILNIRTAVYSAEDVERGKRIAALIADNFGTMSVKRAAEMVDQGS